MAASHFKTAPDAPDTYSVFLNRYDGEVDAPAVARFTSRRREGLGGMGGAGLLFRPTMRNDPALFRSPAPDAEGFQAREISVGRLHLDPISIRANATPLAAISSQGTNRPLGSVNASPSGRINPSAGQISSSSVIRQVGSAGSTACLENDPLRNAAPGAFLAPVSTFGNPTLCEVRAPRSVDQTNDLGLEQMPRGRGLNP